MAKQEIKVSVVVPVRNVGQTLAAQLDALANQEFTEPWEVVVVDNDSDDDSFSVASQRAARFKHCSVISRTDRLGINSARNAGVAAARGEFILLCDGDDIVHPGWLNGHVRTLGGSDISGGPLEETILNTSQDAWWQISSSYDVSGNPTAGGFLPYCYGGNLGFRKEVWAVLGGFDESWSRGGTEIEFCWRAQVAGYTLGFCPDAIVSYRRSPRVSGEYRRAFRTERNLARLFRSHRNHGMRRRRYRSVAASWLWLIYRLPWLGSAQRRPQWILTACNQAGRLSGSIKWRVAYL
jgi:glycosyltransferase involved in cell wall biosynthesis